MYDLVSLGKNARRAAAALRTSGAGERNAALLAAARALRAGKSEILEANRTDVEIARRAGCRLDVLERLSLTPMRIEVLCTRLEAVIAEPDPIGDVVGGNMLSGSACTCSVRVPIGVVAFLPDGDPAAAVDAFAMLVKSGNVCVLAGGKNSYGTDRALVRILRQAIGQAGLTMDALQFVEDVSPETVTRLLHLGEYIDLVIPSGDAEYVHRILCETDIPAFDTAGGCRCMYIDRAAEESVAVRVLCAECTDSAAGTPGIDTVLVHAALADALLPKIKSALDARCVQIHGDERACRILPGLIPLQDGQRGAGYTDMQMNLCIVDSPDDALEQLERYSGHVSDVIITQDSTTAMRFAALVDSASVTVNAAPRFAEGACEGTGITLGFSAGRLHVRGPIGLAALTTLKTVTVGSGQTR